MTEALKKAELCYYAKAINKEILKGKMKLTGL